MTAVAPAHRPGRAPARASRALLGSDFRIMRDHGRFIHTPWASRTMATLHPSAVLRGERDLDVGGVRSAGEIEHRAAGAGAVLINDSTDYRLDAMPFGGVKGSGLGREGVGSAINEMTNIKVVCFNL